MFRLLPGICDIVPLRWDLPKYHDEDAWQRYNQLMTQQALDLLQKALSLSEEERAALADSLLASLDSTVEEGAEKAWEEEVSRRIADIDSGKAKMIPWEEVREELSSRLKHDK